MRKLLRFTYFSLVVLLAVSCEKNGAVGPQGLTGATGTSGNANVKGSTWSIVTWSVKDTLWYTNLTDSALTASVLSSGAVEVFWSTNGGTSWNTMPCSWNKGGNYTWQYSTSLYNIQPQWIFNGTGEGNDPNSTFGAVVSIKVVCIAPSTP
jgi:hypothetical protein